MNNFKAFISLMTKDELKKKYWIFHIQTPSILKVACSQICCPNGGPIEVKYGIVWFPGGSLTFLTKQEKPLKKLPTTERNSSSDQFPHFMTSLFQPNNLASLPVPKIFQAICKFGPQCIPEKLVHLKIIRFGKAYGPPYFQHNVNFIGIPMWECGRAG